ncbi:MAG TPA: helix-turn-helix domain-containing protein, partial [Solirubrobacteraceae bacterium]
MAKSTASTRVEGVGDGLQPPHLFEEAPRYAGLRAWSSGLLVLKGSTMSHRAIAASLTLTGLSTGERLVVFALASFANREQRAWPGTRLAATRAGLSKSQYLAGLRALADRRLVEIEESGGGRARSALIRLAFVEDRVPVELDVNARLFEVVLSAGSTKGSARVLLAVLAALADADGVIAGVTVDALCETAGLSERTYRRARAELISTAMVELSESGGGRGRANRWRVVDPSKGPDIPIRTSSR